MSSAISTDDSGLRPWQFFLLAGMLSATGVVLVAVGQSPASLVVLSLTVVAASFVALGAYRAFAPLATTHAVEAPPVIMGRTRAALEREKTLVLRSIKELEFDYAMKKVAQNDFDEMSARLRARAIGLMRQLEGDDGYRSAIEQELAARLKAGRTSQPPDAAVSSTAMGTSASTERAAGPAAGTLCACGTVNDPDARFCKNCGQKLAAA